MKNKEDVQDVFQTVLKALSGVILIEAMIGERIDLFKNNKEDE